MSFRLLSAVRPLTLLSLLLWAQSALAWWSPDWAYRKAITVDAAAIAVPPGESAKPVVVLVRLHEGVLPFADANADARTSVLSQKMTRRCCLRISRSITDCP